MTDMILRPGAFTDDPRYQPPAFEPFRARDWPRPAEDWERIARDQTKLDPITLDVVEYGLEAAIEEGEATVERTGRSTIIREQHDFRAAIQSMDCRNVTHVSWNPTADPVRAAYDLEDIHEGDVFLYNDVYQALGTITHLPDYCIQIPVFEEGRLLAWVSLMGHTQDVGGKSVGSWPIDSRSVFEEGVQIPVVKYHSRGVVNDEIRRIVARNTRFPVVELGDVDAFVGAARVIERRIHELCARLGADAVEAAMYSLLDRCADAVRTAILPQIPDGEWVGEDFIDTDGVDLDRPVKLRCTMRKDADGIVLDWTGTDPQTDGPINWAVTGRFLSKWIGSYLKGLAPGTVLNEGVTSIFRCHIPPGTVLSPSYPASVANRTQTQMRSFGPYTICLAQAFEGQVVADMQCLQIYGFLGTDADGETVLLREVFGAGSGARPYADGTDAVDMVPNSKNLPAEFIEQRYPVVVERLGLFPDSCGPGKFRGGLGYVKELRVLVDGHFLQMGDRTAFAPFGVFGGKAGAPGGGYLKPGTPEEQHVQFSREGIPVSAGDVIRITTPGGGGWGDPLDRDVDAVRIDVLRGLVSPESAEGDYGVVLVERRGELVVDYEVDEAATAELRADLRAERATPLLIDRGDHARALREAGVIDFADHALPELVTAQAAAPTR